MCTPVHISAKECRTNVKRKGRSRIMTNYCYFDYKTAMENELNYYDILTDKKVREEFIKETYDYASTRSSENKFSEKKALLLLIKYIDFEHVAFTRIWQVFVMFSMEDLVHKLVNEIVPKHLDMECAKNDGMSTLWIAAEKYDFNNNYRRDYELKTAPHTVFLQPQACKGITYLYTAVRNTEKEFVRGENAIQTPGKRAKETAIISQMLKDANYGYININDVIKAFNANGISTSKARLGGIKALIETARNNHFLSVQDNEYYISQVIDDTSIEDEVINKEVNDPRSTFISVVLKMFGYEEAFIAQMLTQERSNKVMSTYAMVEPFRRFKMISRRLDYAAANNKDLASIVDSIKTSICLHGISGAVHKLDDTTGYYLNIAIAEADGDLARIKDGLLTEEECLGTIVSAGKINYQMHQFVPKTKGSGVMSQKNLEKFNRFLSELEAAGLSTVANTFGNIAFKH